MREPSRVELNKPALDRAQALYEDKISLVYAQEGPRDAQNALNRIEDRSHGPDGRRRTPDFYQELSERHQRSARAEACGSRSYAE